MILAGDIGGTKTTLALLEHHGAHRSLLREMTFRSLDYDNFQEMLDLFLTDLPRPEHICLGIAGPVVDGRCQTTNLPWVIDSQELSVRYHQAKVKLLNDLEAMALGMLYLEEDEFIDLNPDAVEAVGHRAVIAAGTGLGEAILYWDGDRHHPMATEGGHGDFAPQSSRQDDLLVYLRERFGRHVSYERILSGAGFSALYDFLVERGFGPACPAVPDKQVAGAPDRNAVISRLGSAGEDPVCIEVIRLFVAIYAAEAGNLALRSLARGGIYIGGGIGPKIRNALQAHDFISDFKAKGRFEPMLRHIPVRLSLNQKTPLIGAMHYFDASGSNQRLTRVIQ